MQSAILRAARLRSLTGLERFCRKVSCSTLRELERLPRHVINHIPQPAKCLLLALTDVCLMPANVRLSGQSRRDAAIAEISVSDPYQTRAMRCRRSSTRYRQNRHYLHGLARKDCEVRMVFEQLCGRLL